MGRHSIIRLGHIVIINRNSIVKFRYILSVLPALNVSQSIRKSHRLFIRIGECNQLLFSLFIIISSISNAPTKRHSIYTHTITTLSYYTCTIIVDGAKQIGRFDLISILMTCSFRRIVCIQRFHQMVWGHQSWDQSVD